jgi:hypothetical protein
MSVGPQTGRLISHSTSPGNAVLLILLVIGLGATFAGVQLLRIGRVEVA